MTQGELKLHTTHPRRTSGNSQKRRLFDLLKDHEWHTTVEILGKVYSLGGQGIARIGARVADLKADGCTIESRKSHGSVWEYRLL